MRNRLRRFAIVAAVLALAVGVAPAPAEALQSSGWTTVVNVRSGLRLTAERPMLDGSGIAQYGQYAQSDGSPAQSQLWRFDEVRPGVYSIRSAGTSTWRALSINNYGTARGVRAIQWRYLGGNDQLFTLQSRGIGVWRLKNVNSGKCLGVNGASLDPAATAIQWDCADRSEMLWSAGLPFTP